MAYKIHLTTDEGELLESWTVDHDGLGRLCLGSSPDAHDLSKPMAREDVMSGIVEEIKAHQRRDRAR